MKVFHGSRAAAFPEFWDRPESGSQPSVAAMTHLVQHTPAGEGPELTAPDGVHTVKIDAAHTDDQYELFEVDAPRGPATPPHRTGWAKAYYVLYGRLLVRVEAAGFDLGSGWWSSNPPGALHSLALHGSRSR